MPQVRFLAGAILALCLAPILSAAMAMGVAALGRCTLDETAAYPCKFAGLDLGGALVNMVSFGWLAMVTLPAGLVIALLWGGVELMRFLLMRRGAPVEG